VGLAFFLYLVQSQNNEFIWGMFWLNFYYKTDLRSLHITLSVNHNYKTQIASLYYFSVLLRKSELH
jgi:hypothetical protein